MLKKWFGFGKKEIEETDKPEVQADQEEAVETVEEIFQIEVTQEQDAVNAEVSSVQTSAESIEDQEPVDANNAAQEDEITEVDSCDENADPGLEEAEPNFGEKNSVEEPFENAASGVPDAVFGSGELKPEGSDSQVEVEEESGGFFARLKKGLSSTSKSFTSKLERLFVGYRKVDDSIYEELEELLILSDLGYEASIQITETLRARAQEKRIEASEVLKQELIQIIEEILMEAETEGNSDSTPRVMIIVGVNGVGKTTSIGKISAQLKQEGKTVMLAAGDTFRAAAAEQLGIWAERANVPIVRSHEGADPSSVIFDAIQSAKARNTDVLICDTAGRLHNKKNLMQELEKILRIVNREYPEAQKEVLLVIDATTGQNALSQAKLFSEVAPLTGIILTKLDGTAKGGVVIALAQELKIPIRYIGVGEKIGDLQQFDAHQFAQALFQ